MEGIFAVILMPVWAPLQRTKELPVPKVTRGSGLTMTTTLSNFPTQPFKEVVEILYATVPDVGVAVESVFTSVWLIRLPLPGADPRILLAALVVQEKVLGADALRLILVLPWLQIVAVATGVNTGLGFTLTLMLSRITLTQEAGAGEVTVII